MLRSLMHPLRRPVALAATPDLGRIQRFPLLEVVGRGSMGVVYRSFDPQHHRPVALKVLHPELLEPGGAGLRSQLRAEAEAAAALAHPGIVAVYEYGEAGALAYLVMEYVRGMSLRARLRQGESFSSGRALGLASQLLDALAHAHRCGIWHRDIKPANILVTSQDRLKLTDFGIARPAGAERRWSDDILGSAGYIAPETYLTETSDARADLFAAGAVLYELFTGVPAYGGTRAQIMFRVCSGSPLPPSVAAGRSALEPFDAVLLRALAVRPEERFASAGEFRRALLSAGGLH
jgi:eukaryotic-like serine/threonine-protein kinase